MTASPSLLSFTLLPHPFPYPSIPPPPLSPPLPPTTPFTLVSGVITLHCFVKQLSHRHAKEEDLARALPLDSGRGYWMFANKWWKPATCSLSGRSLISLIPNERSRGVIRPWRHEGKSLWLAVTSIGRQVVSNRWIRSRLSILIIRWKRCEVFVMMGIDKCVCFFFLQWLTSDKL